MAVYRSTGLIPDVPWGTVLWLAPDQWQYSYGETLTLRVESVRRHLGRYYLNQVWVEGWMLHPVTGADLRWCQALVLVEALAAHVAAGNRANRENGRGVGDG